MKAIAYISISLLTIFVVGYLSSFDFDVEGKRIVTFDTRGNLLLSDVDNDKCLFHKKISGKEGKKTFVSCT